MSDPQATGCASRFIQVSRFALVVSTLAMAVGLVLLLIAARNVDTLEQVDPGVLVGVLLLLAGLAVFFVTLLISLPVTMILAQGQETATTSPAQSRLVGDWRQAGMVERASYVVAIPLLVLVVLDFDWLTVWLLLGTLGGAALADEYLSSGGRLSPRRRRWSVLAVLGCLLVAGSYWLLDEAAFRLWALSLFLLLVIGSGIVELLAMRRKRASR